MNYWEGDPIGFARMTTGSRQPTTSQTNFIKLTEEMKTGEGD